MTSQKTFRRGFWLIACSSVAWGTSGLSFQIMYSISNTNALSLAFWRLAIATPLFLLSGWLVLDRSLFHIKRRDLWVMLLMGGLQASYQASFIAALPLAGVMVSTLIALCVAPVIVAVFSALMVREHLAPLTLLALVGALGGTTLLVLARSQPHKADLSLLGVILALISASCYAGFVLCGRRVTAHYHTLQINSIAFGSGSVLLLLLASSTSLAIVYPITGWLILLYLGSIPTALAYGLFQIGMRLVSATVTSIVTLCEPLTASLLAILFLHETLHATGLLGAALLLGALGLILLAPRT